MSVLTTHTYKGRVNSDFNFKKHVGEGNWILPGSASPIATDTFLLGCVVVHIMVYSDCTVLPLLVLEVEHT